MKPITGIHQIEITSRCNLRCKYCVHPTMGRWKGNMGPATWAQTLALVDRFVQAGTQGRELNLCGIGESTLHPLFCTMVGQAREVIGPQRELILATNGVGVTEEHAKAMREARMRVWVSLHRPEKAGPTVNLLRRYGVLAGTSSDPSLSAVDWAGQVKWEVTAPPSPCPWLLHQWGFVMADGSISRCCFDGEGVGRIATVWDEVEALRTGPYELCAKCHHVVVGDWE